jgi:hypothetical protein
MKFKSNIEVQAGIEDKDGQVGSNGQILASTGSQVDWIDPANIVTSATDVIIECKNTSGVTIAKGTPVYQTGNVGATAVIEVAVADASDEDKMAAIGLLQSDLINNAFGYVVVTGELLNITTSPIDGVTPTTGDTIYVKPGGGLTLTKPTGVNFIQNVGLVGKVSGGNAGSITVSSIMRSNDVPTPLYVDHDNQRLGIGTTSPGTKLDIRQSTSGGSDVLGTGAITIGSDNPYWTFRGTATSLQDLAFDRNYAGTWYESMRIQRSTGNVGIGTTSPTHLLTLENASSPGLKIKDTTQGATLLAFSQDSNSHIGTYSSHPLVLDTNSTERMRITSAGNVGIGTTSPSNPLHVYSSDNILATFESTDGISEIRIKDDTKYTRLLTVGGHFKIMPNDGVEMAVFEGETGRTLFNGGNVGIGTTSPNYKLASYSSGDEFAIVAGAGNAVGEFTGIGLSGYIATNAAVKAGLVFERETSWGIGKMHFLNNNTLGDSDATLSDSKMTIDSDGNVGIGRSSSITARLFVEGPVDTSTISTSSTPAARINNGGAISNWIGSNGYNYGYIQSIQDDGSNNLKPLSLQPLGGNVGIGTTNPNAKLTVKGSGLTSQDFFHIEDSGGVRMLEVTSDAAGNATLQVKDTSGTTKSLINSSGNSYFNGGNVGIGTTSPSEKLVVDGKVIINNTTPPNNLAQLNIGSTSGGETRAIDIDGNWTAGESKSITFAYGYNDTHMVGQINCVFNGSTDSRLRWGKLYHGGATSTYTMELKSTSATTADLTVAGSINVNTNGLINFEQNTDIDTGAEVVAQVAHATYTAAFFDFVVKKGTNVRSGTVYACHNGDSTPLVEFTETSTNDLGDTSDVTLSVDISGANMRLLATVTSDDWSVKSLIRAI